MNNLFNLISFKKIIIIILLISLFGILASLYAQYIIGLNPCNLCILQRVIIIFISVISFIFIFLKNKLFKILYIISITLFSIFGIFISIKQIFILNQPKENFLTCGADFNFLFKTLPFYEFYKTLITGTSDCTEVQKLFFLPIPAWSLILFILIFILIILSLFKIKD